jgi:hypothetical protein
MRWHNTNSARRPFVFEMIVEPADIIAFNNARSEFEVIIRPAAADCAWMEGEPWFDFDAEGRAPDTAVER